MRKIMILGALVSAFLINDASAQSALPDLSKPLQSQSHSLQINQEQAWFIEVINIFKNEYLNSKNRLAKSQLREKRKQYFKETGFINFTDWVLEVDKISNDYLYAKFKDQKILINHRSSSSWDDNYMNIATKLTPGNIIVVTGNFHGASHSKERYKEISITEKGSMTDPEFVVRSKSIKIIK